LNPQGQLKNEKEKAPFMRPDFKTDKMLIEKAASKNADVTITIIA